MFEGDGRKTKSKTSPIASVLVGGGHREAGAGRKEKTAEKMRAGKRTSRHGYEKLYALEGRYMEGKKISYEQVDFRRLSKKKIKASS